jgi:AhpD family alkylhydroperoxidase
MRLNWTKILPGGAEALRELERVVDTSSLEPLLCELIKVRASQINQCAFCLDMHTKDARSLGESEQRLYLVASWRETALYSPRERAALAWTEALTLLPELGAPDAVYAGVAEVFTQEEQVALTLAIVAINAWNRLAVGFATPAGGYVSRLRPPD